MHMGSTVVWVGRGRQGLVCRGRRQEVVQGDVQLDLDEHGQQAQEGPSGGDACAFAVLSDLSVRPAALPLS